MIQKWLEDAVQEVWETPPLVTVAVFLFWFTVTLMFLKWLSP